MNHENLFLTELMLLIQEDNNNNNNLTKLIDTFFSLTPDNSNLTTCIRVSTLADVDTGKPTRKLNIKGYELSRIAHEFEDLESVPDELQEIFPNLELNDWNAFKRLVTLIFLSLEISK